MIVKNIKSSKKVWEYQAKRPGQNPEHRQIFRNKQNACEWKQFLELSFWGLINIVLGGLGFIINKE